MNFTTPSTRLRALGSSLLLLLLHAPLGGCAGDDGTGSASASTGSSSGDATTTGDPGTDNECDPSKQDCPEGEKCTPYVKEGMGCCVNATHCVPDEGDKQFGDLCTRMNGTD
ncbi:MAG: hypothetical protein KC420_21795, partial [Myxococcales bacterium]|nr:hypothetical protein [Myxococcales bacterium]